MTEDAELLRRYAESRSEEAFAELVRRRIGLVYSVAWRQTRDAHRAEDVVQAVFTDLARKAAVLARRPVLVGWLYRSAHYAAADIVRAELRRARREEKAHLMQTLLADDPADDAWQKVRPLLDAAMGDLSARDRDAILLRFFDDRSFGEIGTRLALSEGAARMRVERALDQLHAALARRGVTSTAATLGAALAGQGALAAPSGLAAAVTGAALASAAGGGSALFSLMAVSKLQAGLVAALAVAGVGTYAVYQSQRAPAPEAASAASVETRAAAVVPPSRVATIPTAPAAVAAPPAEPVTLPAIAASGSSSKAMRADLIAQWIATSENPAVLRALAAEARGLTTARFGGLFEDLHLGSERTEAFARLLDEKRQAPMDIAVASYKNGIDVRSDMAAFEANVARTREKLEREIHAFLGDPAYGQYLAYNQDQGVRDAFIRMGRVLDGTSDVLTAEQTTQLKAVLKSGSDGNLSLEKIAAARGFLTPPQMDALQRAFEQQRNTKAGRFQDALPPRVDGK